MERTLENGRINDIPDQKAQLKQRKVLEKSAWVYLLHHKILFITFLGNFHLEGQRREEK